MLILVPIITTFILYLNRLGSQRNLEKENPSFRRAIIEAVIIFGVFVAITSELLGLIHRIETLWVAAAWGLLMILNVFIGLKKNLLKRGIKRLQACIHLEGKIEYFYTGLILVVLILTFVTGLLSPPNNYDSFLYHMPRVAHWIQNSSLGHYGTAYINQLAFPIWAEEGIMTVWLFWGNDSLSNLVQWLAFVCSILIISYLTRILGGSRNAQWLAAIFAMSIPTVILQSSSTQNDLVTGLWFLCFLAYVIESQNRSLTRMEVVFCACALGLGLLTKGTFYLYAFIFLIFFLVQILKRERLRRGLLLSALIGVLVLVLNAGYWLRNIITYKSPLGTTSLIIHHVYGGSLPEVLLNPLRNLAVNFVTPSEEINYQLFRWMFSPKNDNSAALPPYGVVFSWNDEDYAGNPIQTLVCLFVFIFLFIKFKQYSNPLLFYAVGLLESIIIFSLALHYNPFINRLEIPFFLASACMVGIVLDGLIKKNWIRTVILLLLVLTAMPWVLFNKTRPLLGLRTNPEPLALRTNPLLGETQRSIFIEWKVVTFFARSKHLLQPRTELISRIRESDCQDIGLRISSSDPEYPYFWLLSAPLSGYRIESLEVMQETVRYLDPAFRPCAIICVECDPGQAEMDLERIGKFGDATLYLNE
jgi:hypothetical protein